MNVELCCDIFAEPPRITSLKNTQPLPTDAIFGDDVYFVHDPRGYKSVVHHLANSYLENKNETITDNRLKLNTVPSYLFMPDTY